MNYKPIIIVAGEPNSIFFEIFLKIIQKNKFKSPIILIGSKYLLNKQIKFLKSKIKIEDLSLKKNLKKIQFNKINLFNVDYIQKKAFDKISSKSNNYINNCFKIAINLLKKQISNKLINGPISKKHFLKGKNLGITEYLAKKISKNCDVAMLIFNKKLSVSPITTHLALKDVNKYITKKKIYSHVKLITKFYKKNFKKKPRIAITGLNPHCESNFKNCEEDAVIIPAIKKLRIKNFKVDGPFPADTIFMKENLRNFDIIIGMYHDQVLSPMKALLGFDAINITLGLPFVRVSPDHGPNSSMLGKNLSNPTSLIKALKFLDK